MSSTPVSPAMTGAATGPTDSTSPTGPTPDKSAVRVRGLRKTFGPVVAVDSLDLTVAPGEVVAFLGPNGAGKSTTLDVVLGFTRPDAGTAAVWASPRGRRCGQGASARSSRPMGSTPPSRCARPSTSSPPFSGAHPTSNR